MTNHPLRCETCKKFPCPELLKASETMSNSALSVTIRELYKGFTARVGCASHSRAIVGIHCPLCGWHQTVPVDEWHFQSTEGHGHTCGSGKCPSHTYLVLDTYTVSERETVLALVRDRLCSYGERALFTGKHIGGVLDDIEEELHSKQGEQK